jgi:MFS family permease
MREGLQVYWLRVRQFSPNARLYLASTVLTGAALGVYSLLFNFYLFSLKLDVNVAGQLASTNSTAALLLTVPMGYLADLLGRKGSLIASGVGISLSIAGMVLWPLKGALFAMNLLLGAAQSLSAVTMAPFLLENSGAVERTYLFSLGSGAQVTASFLGNALGGVLPTWIAVHQRIQATSAPAYAGALLIVAVASLVGLLPLFFLHRLATGQRSPEIFAPFAYAAKKPVLLGKWIAPILVTSIGAGLLMPFMNVFFRVAYHQPDQVIGNLLAWGALAMGIGLLAAPLLADRIGRIQVVVITQALSIPFLALLGFAPWFWLSGVAYYIRIALMNMSSPVYQAFVMEQVDQEARATVASLVNMANNFGRSFSPSISGWLQLNYGFAPVYAGVILLYSVAIYLYWRYFWSAKTAGIPDAVPAE